MSPTEVITTAINLSALIFLAAQVMLARKALREAAEGQEREWNRQRKKATIDATVATAQYRESIRALLPWNDRDPKAMAAFLEKAGGDYDKLAPLSGYLNSLDDIAVGVKQGVLDLETVSMLFGSRIIDVVASYAPYMESIRRGLDRPQTWSDLDDLVELLKKLRQESTEALSEQEQSTKLNRPGWLKLKPVGKRTFALPGMRTVWTPWTALVGLVMRGSKPSPRKRIENLQYDACAGEECVRERERDHQVLSGNEGTGPRPGRRLSRALSRAGALTGTAGRRRATGPASLSMWLLAVTRSPAPR